MRGELVHGCEYRPSLKIDEEMYRRAVVQRNDLLTPLFVC